MTIAGGYLDFIRVSGGTYRLPDFAVAGAIVIAVESATTVAVASGTLTYPGGSGSSVSLAPGIYHASTVTGGWLVRQMDADHVATADYASAALTMSATLPPESGFLWAWRSPSGKALLGFRVDSHVLACTVDAALTADMAASAASAATAANATTADYASAALTMSATLPPESGFLWAWRSPSGKALLGFRVDSHVLACTVDAALTADMAASAASAATAANATTADYASAALNMSATLPPESGWVEVWRSPSGKAVFGIRSYSETLSGTIDKALTADTAASAASAARATLLDRAQWVVDGAAYVAQTYLSGATPKVRVIGKADGGVARTIATAGAAYDPQITDDDFVVYYDAALAKIMYEPAAGGTAYPVLPASTITVGGDSLSQSLGPALNTAIGGGIVRTRGYGGRDSTEIAVILGALTTIVTGTIPASGAASVTLSRDLLGVEIMDVASIDGTIAGIAGTLSRDGGGAYTFTRTVAGTALTIPASTPFRSSIMTQAELDANIWWVGRNDWWSGVVDNNVAALIVHLKPRVKRFLILGITTYGSATEASGTTNYNTIVAYNDAQLAAYGNALTTTSGRFFDVRRWLVDNGPALVAAQGLTWTAADTQCIAWDTIPASLMNADLLHLTSATQSQIAATVKTMLQARGWI